jgi:hypothetical protein
MPQLHFTDVSVVGHPVRLAAAHGDFWSAIADPRDRPELVDGTPFILGDDGSYDLRLNRFFRECPSVSGPPTASGRMPATSLPGFAFSPNAAGARVCGRPIVRMSSPITVPAAWSPARARLPVRPGIAP